MKKVIIISCLVLIIGVVGVMRFNYLATKPINTNEFSYFNKVEIYTGYLAVMVGGYPMYPEAAIQLWYMLFPSSKYKEIVFKSDFFKDSIVIKEAIKNYTSPKKLYWHPNNYNLGHPEARVALTFNGGILYIKGEEVIVKVPAAWPQHAKAPLIKFPKIVLEEGLFWILQKESWIYPYTAVWKYTL